MDFSCEATEKDSDDDPSLDLDEDRDSMTWKF